MWLLNAQTHQLEAFEGSSVPPYAILSHRWEEDEVLFADMIERRHEARKGWAKIRSCCEWACANDLRYAWIDTCCIDKKSSAELSEAINSMFRWYRESTVCYTYLCDVSDQLSLAESMWFTRGWTLQELLAPRDMFFFDKDWNYIDSKSDLQCLEKLIEKTGIPRETLQNFDPKSVSGETSIAQVMSWAAGRQTTRIEDQAYSLMGLFNVNMPLLYGEGSKAFIRLQTEIMKDSNDLSILAWEGVPDPSLTMLAASPVAFAKCRDFGSIHREYDITKHGLIVDALLFHLDGDRDRAMAVACLRPFHRVTDWICIRICNNFPFAHQDQSVEDKYLRVQPASEPLIGIAVGEELPIPAKKIRLMKWYDYLVTEVEFPEDGASQFLPACAETFSTSTPSIRTTRSL